MNIKIYQFKFEFFFSTDALETDIFFINIIGDSSVFMHININIFKYKYVIIIYLYFLFRFVLFDHLRVKNPLSVM